ncbi:hypothetical protein [Salinispora mooreana]|uniref:hypothetical protein n=1 Tax=Salinispora mooreana TaxID=999545 RepID=UPI0003712F66|nr:hypothetical protein [Salinispora mooreana]
MSERASAGPEALRPKYVQLSRQQQSALDEVARELMDARTRTGGQRITANTLIRIAVDALLAQRSALVGDDEAALREAYFRALGIQDSTVG